MVLRYVKASLLTVALFTLAAAFLAPLPAFSNDSADNTHTDPFPSLKTHYTQATFKVCPEMDGEVYPVFANYTSLQKPADRTTGTVFVTVHNESKNDFFGRISMEVSGWSDQEIQVAELKAGGEARYLFAPTYLPRFYENREIVAATARVSVTDGSGRVVFASTVPLHLRSADDMFWGKQFHNAEFIASWVMPHDPHVEQVLSQAKNYMPGKRMPGYEEGKGPLAEERSTWLEAKAIYQALQHEGVAYVKSSATLGGHQDWSERVRTPGESIQQDSANCIDGAVLYASLFENLGMEPVIVLVPGHAYVGVRKARDSEDVLYIETALTGRAPFESAIAAAQRELAKYSPAQTIRVPILTARHNGIYPMPIPATTKDAITAQQLSSAKLNP